MTIPVMLQASGGVAVRFNTVLFEGNSSTNAITGVGFTPDLVWWKNRDSAVSWSLMDSVRGVNLLLEPDNSSADVAVSGTYITSFDPDGFTLVGSGGNANGDSHVAFCFQENESFFDIVTYTGNGANRTIAHGLNGAPEFMIIKNRDNVSPWSVWHSGLTTPTTARLILDNKVGQTNDATYWNSTTPTASVFSLGTHVDVNTDTDEYIAYLFDSDGINCVTGTYTGDGSTDGSNTISTPFEVGMVLIKQTDADENWVMIDTARGESLKLATDIPTVEAAVSFDLNAASFAGKDVSTNGNTLPYAYIAFKKVA